MYVYNKFNNIKTIIKFITVVEFNFNYLFQFIFNT